MKLIQNAIFIENSPGRVAEVCGTLGKAGVNIRALSMGDGADYGVLRIVADDPAKAKEVLKKNGFTVADAEVVAAEIPDKPGGLAGVLEMLGKKGVNVEYMYVLVMAAKGAAYVIFRFNDNDSAIKALLENGVRILKGEEVYGL